MKKYVLIFGFIIASSSTLIAASQQTHPTLPKLSQYSRGRVIDQLFTARQDKLMCKLCKVDFKYLDKIYELPWNDDHVFHFNCIAKRWSKNTKKVFCQCCKQYMTERPVINFLHTIQSKHLIDALLYAIKINAIAAVENLVNNYDVDVDDCSQGQAPLHVAIEHKRLPIIDFLLEKGADITQQNYDATTAEEMIYENRWERCIKLFNYYQEPEATTENNHNESDDSGTINDNHQPKNRSRAHPFSGAPQDCPIS